MKFLTLAISFIMLSSEAYPQLMNRGMVRRVGFMCSMNQDTDVFVPISKYIRLGDAEKLSVWFADNLELDILGSINDCSKTQATQIMKNFFITYAPKSFTIIHKSGKAPMKYAIGNLSAGGETFRITLFVKTQSSGNHIQQLRIERK